MTVFFCILATYHGLILDQPISYFHYTSAIVQALIISKMILIGESFKLGEKWEDKPLIFPTLYKTLIFTFFVLIFTVIEHFIIGYLRGYDTHQIYHELISKGLYDILARILVVLFVFLLFFAFTEIANYLGGNKLLKLFFSKKD